MSRCTMFAVLLLAGCQTTAPVVPLAPPALPASGETLDLGTSLRLGQINNPTIRLAHEQIREALAEQTAANALLLPDLAAGASVRIHQGVLQTAAGRIDTINSQSAMVGNGTGAVGAGSPAVPGVRVAANLADAIYEPLAARQRVAASTADAQAVDNDTLADIGVAHIQLTAAAARIRIYTQARADVAELVRLTKAYAAQGQGRVADAHRAEANAELVERAAKQADEEWAVASARLCGLLSLDPTNTLSTDADAFGPVSFVTDVDAIALQAQALRQRPDLLARGAEILEARQRVKQEDARPWLPTVIAGFSGTSFGGGRDAGNYGQFAGRTDFDVAAVWTFQNLGVGNASRVRRARSIVGQTLAEYDDTRNRIRREVSEWLAESEAAAQQTEVALRAVQTAVEGYKLETERIRQGQGFPIEALDSFRQLLDARLDLLQAVTRHNSAQIRLVAVVGQSPQVK